jgi:hypothetical protein
MADWKDNVQSGLEWDANRLTSNKMMHPLHGAMYVDAARSNGYGYVGSTLMRRRSGLIFSGITRGLTGRAAFLVPMVVTWY